MSRRKGLPLADASDTVTTLWSVGPNPVVNVGGERIPVNMPSPTDELPTINDYDPSLNMVKVQVFPAKFTVTVSGTQQIQAIGFYEDGGTVNLTAAATWVSSASGTASVTAGLVTGVANGYAEVTATFNGLSATAQVTVGTGYFSLVRSHSPLLYWRLADASGSSTADSSGNSKTGTITGQGSITFQAAGLLTGDANTCMSASTVTPNIQRTGDDLGMSAGDPFSMVWMSTFTTAAALSNMINIATAGLADNIALFYRNTDGSIYSAVGAATMETAAGTLSLSTTYHLAITFDGENCYLYRNGQIIAANTASYAFAWDTVYLGGANPLRWAGKFDEFALFGQYLNSSQIAALYASASGA